MCIISYQPPSVAFICILCHSECQHSFDIRLHFAVCIQYAFHLNTIRVAFGRLSSFPHSIYIHTPAHPLHASECVVNAFVCKRIHNRPHSSANAFVLTRIRNAFKCGPHSRTKAFTTYSLAFGAAHSATSAFRTMVSRGDLNAIRMRVMPNATIVECT
jgi:hypothetical protein